MDRRKGSRSFTHLRTPAVYPAPKNIKSYPPHLANASRAELISVINQQASEIVAMEEVIRQRWEAEDGG